jgi:hypothetical protein
MRETFLIRDIKDNLFIECGIYGFRQDGHRNYYKALEEKVFELKGIKALISYDYYDESVFWEIIDRESYQKVKRITDPQNLFRDLYRKTHLNSTAAHFQTGYMCRSSIASQTC